jgi:hypothetical protein
VKILLLCPTPFSDLAVGGLYLRFSFFFFVTPIISQLHHNTANTMKKLYSNRTSNTATDEWSLGDGTNSVVTQEIDVDNYIQGLEYATQKDLELITQEDLEYARQKDVELEEESLHDECGSSKDTVNGNGFNRRDIMAASLRQDSSFSYHRSSLFGLHRAFNWNKNEGEVEKALALDIYSVLYTAPYFSVPFFFSLFIVCSQFGIFLFLLADIINVSSDEDWTKRLHIPAGKDAVVLLAQVIAAGPIMVIDIFDKDLMRGFSQLMRGYDAQILQQSPHATRAKWILASTLQMTVGSLYICASLMLLLQVTTVQELVFNFAAIEFLCMVDDMAFEFGMSGLVHTRVQKACKHVEKLRYAATETGKLRFIVLCRCLLVAVSIGCFTFTGYVSHRQLVRNVPSKNHAADRGFHSLFLPYFSPEILSVQPSWFNSMTI